MITNGLFVGVESYANHADLHLKRVGAVCDDLYRRFSLIVGNGVWEVAAASEVASVRDLRNTVKSFLKRIEGDAIVYLAAHGFDEDGDIQISTSGLDLDREAGSVSLSSLLRLAAGIEHLILVVADCCREFQGEGEIEATASKLIVPNNVSVLFACAPGERTPCDERGPMLGQGIGKALADSRLMCRTRDSGLPLEDLVYYLENRLAAIKAHRYGIPSFERCKKGDIIVPYAGAEVIRSGAFDLLSSIESQQRFEVSLFSTISTNLANLDALRSKLEHLLTAAAGTPWPGSCRIVEDLMVGPGYQRLKISLVTPVPELCAGLIGICILESAVSFDFLLMDSNREVSTAALVASGWKGSAREFILECSLRVGYRAVFSMQTSGLWKLHLERQLGITYTAGSLAMNLALVKRALISLYWVWSDAYVDGI